MQRVVFFLMVFSLGAVMAGCGQRSTMQDTVADNRTVIERLPPADREAALAQWSCAECGEMLGSQGQPVKAEIEAKPVFFCSQKCADESAKDPARTRARLEQ